MAPRLLLSFRHACLITALGAFVAGMPSHVRAQAQEEAAASEWYFIGGIAGDPSRGGSGFSALGLSDPLPALDVQDSVTPWPMTGGDLLSLGMDEPERFEFVLVLSDTADLDRLGFSSGQALSISVPRDSYSFFVNRSVEVDLGSAVTPHFMAGLGMTYQVPPGEETLGVVERENWQPALQLGVGASYDLGNQFAITARLRALYLRGDGTGEVGTLDSQFSQDFFVGARIRF